MSCEFSSCREIPAYFCDCNCNLSLFCSHHKIEHTINSLVMHNVRKYSSNDYQFIVYSHFSNEIQRISSKIIENCREEIDKINAKVLKLLKDFQQIKSILQDSFLYVNLNENTTKKISEIIKGNLENFPQNLQSFKKSALKYLVINENKHVAPNGNILLIPEKPYNSGSLIKIQPKPYDKNIEMLTTNANSFNNQKFFDENHYKFQQKSESNSKIIKKSQE